MTAEPLTIGIHADGLEAEARDLGMTLATAGFKVKVFGSGQPAARQREGMARHDMIVFLQPESQPARQTVGLAAGLGRPVAVLASNSAAAASLPHGVKALHSTRQLVAHVRREAVRLGRTERHISHETLKQYGTCPAGIDWFRSLFPKGRPMSDWSPDMQRYILLNGGAPWLHGGVRYGWIKFFAMNGEDFSGLDLDRLKLPDTELRGADFTNAVLTGSDLQRAELSGARFVEAAMSQADLIGARLDEADFSRAGLVNARFDETIAEKARFDGADCTGANFQKADLRGASFAGADLRRAFFRDADLRGARFDEARLDKAYLAGAKLDSGALDAAATMERVAS